RLPDERGAPCAPRVPRRKPRVHAAQRAERAPELLTLPGRLEDRAALLKHACCFVDLAGVAKGAAERLQRDRGQLGRGNLAPESDGASRAWFGEWSRGRQGCLGQVPQGLSEPVPV